MTAAAVPTGAAACRDVLRSLGPEPAALRAHASQLFGALVVRYTQPTRDAKYDVARIRLAKSSVTPSRAFEDTAIWTSAPAPQVRDLVVQGGLDNGRYRFVSRVIADRPAKLGDSRHVVELTRLGDSEYAWTAAVDFSLGDLDAATVGALGSALLGSAEGHTERDLRADYRAAAPRSTAVLGALLSVDTLQVRSFSDGSSLVVLYAGIHSAGLRPRYPAFADYVARYVDPAHWRLTLTDRSGALWFEARGGDGRLMLRYRSARGRLVPMFGAPRARPDTMELHVDFTTKIKLFTIGLRNLSTDFIFTSAAHEQAWTILARKEPEWDLPLITERLLRTPLRRPFEKQGVFFRLGVRDSAGAQTLLERRTRVEVRESAIVRFIGSLGSRAVSDLSERAERDEELFLRDLFVALEGDARGLAALGSLGGGAAAPAAAAADTVVRRE